MFDRFSVMVGTGAVAAGLSAAVLTGAGTALAAPDGAPGGDTSASGPTSSADSETGATSDETDPTSDEPSAADDLAAPTADADEVGGVDESDVVDETDVTEENDETDEVDQFAEADGAEDAEAERSGGPDRETPEAELSAPAGEEQPVEETQHDDVPDVDTGETVRAAEVTDVVADPVPRRESAKRTEPVGAPSVDSVVTPMVMTPAAEAASDLAAQPARQTLLSVLGSIVFNVYGGLIRVFGGPPQVPRGSSVTVRSSTLEIDCGEGYDVPADWYVPAGATPQRLVYLQHGFLAAGPFYSYTAAHLAESTNSVVVTTSLTSNFLACDGCWLGGSPMHRAVADLFADGNTALADSAFAAGYSSTLLDGVDKVALSGHSAGGGLVAGTAGYMVGNGTLDRLAGVVMLDGVGFGTVLPDALAKLPADVPIYNLSGRSYYWNMSGSSNSALAAARPGEFVGVRLVDGLHSDTMLGGNPLIQFSLYLVTGFSREQNIDAAEILNAAWLNDMFAGATASPYYGQPGELLEIDTPRGTATAYVTPGPVERLTLVDHVFRFFSNIVFGIDFATCADQPGENWPISASDTPLSLDGRAKPGQSIGQHVCTG